VNTPVINLWRPWFHWGCRMFFGLRFRGVEHIPREGAVIIVPNHQTYADPALVTIPVRRPIYYMAWSRLFDIPVFGAFIRILRAFPVQIESSDPKATRDAVRLLQEGHAVMIFPEGQRSADGTVGRFKPGAFRLATTLDVPILPVTIAGGHESWPRGRIVPRPASITITYHPLLNADKSLESREAARDLAARTKAVIATGLF
jgi:1-acyl-sn-glycerol-3-phosphate acyltransferase